MFLTKAGDHNNVTTAGQSSTGLQNNGGPTETIALLPTSSAVNGIPAAACTDALGNPVTTDQRGVTRPQGSGCDIGVFELVPQGLTIAPASLNFGTVYLGTITTRNITLSNSWATPIALSEPLVSIVNGGSSYEFLEVNLCPKSLASGKQCTIDIAFFAGPFYTPQTASLKIMDNAPGNPQTVMLTATVIDPQANFSPGSLSFGNQAVGASASKTITLWNTARLRCCLAACG